MQSLLNDLVCKCRSGRRLIALVGILGVPSVPDEVQADALKLSKRLGFREEIAHYLIWRADLKAGLAAESRHTLAATGNTEIRPSDKDCFKLGQSYFSLNFKGGVSP
ncbi:MAG: hypothetical protein R8K48_07785 [Gallionella sp.]